MEGPDIPGPKIWLNLNRKSEQKIINHINILQVSSSLFMFLFKILFGLAKARLMPKAITKFALDHPPTTTQTFKAHPGHLGSLFSVCYLILTQLEEIPRKKIGSEVML